MSQPEKPVPFYCSLCATSFSQKKSLLRHQSNFHGREKDGMNCILCDCKVTNNSVYCEHLSEVHEIKIDRETTIFDTKEELLAWKSELEKKTSSFYLLRSETQTKSYFYCNRSGVFVTKGTGQRHLKVQGTRKINGKCPSMFKVESIDGKHYVELIKTHVGHSKELKHVNIPSDDKLQLAGMLSSGIPKQTILEKIRSSWTEECSARIHLTTNKDLINLARSMNLGATVCRDPNDIISVESWIKEMNESDDDPILHYVFDEDNKNFELAIATRGQRYMLEKYCHNIIAIDSTHGTNDYAFQLTTIMVIDENKNAFPAAFLYSSHVDTKTCISFFNSLKKCCNVASVNTFMSDDFDGYYNAWKEVFGQPKNHLLCIWHVYRNWNKHLNTIKDSSLRSTIKADLFHLQKVLDESQFTRLLNFFKQKYTSSAPDFIKYIEDYYEGRANQWAACHRKFLGINTNMYLENLHRNLKYTFMHGRKVRRMDESLSILMKLAFNAQFERVLRQEKGYLPKKLAELRQRHKQAESAEFQYTIDPQNNQKYSIVSSKGDDIYTVEFMDEIEECHCLIKCDTCKICIQTVKCNCYDFAIRGNLCKHTHYIALTMEKTSNPDKCIPDDAAGPNLIVDDLQTNDLAFEKSIFLSQNANNTHRDNIQIKQNELIARVTSLIKSCTNEEMLTAAERFIKPMAPTLLAISRASTISLDSVSPPMAQNKRKTIDQQRRFWTKKTRSTTKKQLRPSTIDFEDWTNRNDADNLPNDNE